MPDSVKRCISCDVVAGQRVEPGGTLYEDGFWHVGSVLEPVVWRGFTIVKLRRYCEHLAQLTPQEAGGLGPVLRATCQALTDVLHPGKGAYLHSAMAFSISTSGCCRAWWR